MPRTPLRSVCPRCRAGVNVPSPRMGAEIPCPVCGKPFVPIPAGKTTLHRPGAPQDVAGSLPVAGARRFGVPLVIGIAALAALAVVLLLAALIGVVLVVSHVQPGSIAPGTPPALTASAPLPEPPRTEQGRTHSTPPRTEAAHPPMPPAVRKPARATPELQAERKKKIDAWTGRTTSPINRIQPTEPSVRLEESFWKLPEAQRLEILKTVFDYVYLLPAEYKPDEVFPGAVLWVDNLFDQQLYSYTADFGMQQAIDRHPAGRVKPLPPPGWTPPG